MSLVLRLAPVPLASARAFVPAGSDDDLVVAYAAGGGYPLHLLAWDGSAPAEDNLRRLAFTPGGLLLEDAPGIVGDEVPDAPGYPQILAAAAAGRTRASQIADLAGQRVEHPLGVLVEAGLLRREIPLGAPALRSLAGSTRYALADPYLSFCYRVLYGGRGLVEAGQGAAVQARATGAVADAVGATSEQGAREHAVRLVAAGELPTSVVGRWWAERGEPVEVDVLGLDDGRSVLVGEARWRDAPLGQRELARLRRRAVRVPEPSDDLLHVLWGRRGPDPAVAAHDVRGFELADVLGGR